MPGELLHICGPLSIQWYGVMILIGLLLFFFCALPNPLRKKYLTKQQFIDLISSGIIAGIIGGRLLNIVIEWEDYSFDDIFKLWEGGFSILGTVITIAIYIPWYLSKKNIPIVPVLDLTGIYAPLLQSVSRIGCFLAGCCHGMLTHTAWGVVCHNPSVPKMLGQLVYPTQLYSAAALLCIFLIMRFFIYPHANKWGQLTSWYLIFIGLERFILDFWRAHQTGIEHIPLTLYQLIALGIICVGSATLIFCSFIRPKIYEHF